MKEQDILSIKNLFFSFGNKLILNDVNLTIPKGSFCAIIGDNGAGKTTTIKSILGIFKAKYDSILVNNMNVADALKNNIIGYVPEKENFSKTTVID
jgi:ABC-type Mn2+/Zn2+ transport system ATPase subunit